VDISKLYEEVSGYIENFNVTEDGEHIWTNYEEATSILLRLTEIRNGIAYLELLGKATTEAKKFRTTILDPSIDRFEKIAAYESRKISGKQIEWDMSRK
jgi:hypothetical protein